MNSSDFMFWLKDSIFAVVVLLSFVSIVFASILKTIFFPVYNVIIVMANKFAENTFSYKA